MKSLYILGVDPGVTTGVACLTYLGEPGGWRPHELTLFQCDSASVLRLVDCFTETIRDPERADVIYEKVTFAAAIEGWAQGRRGRSQAGSITRNLIGTLGEFFGREKVPTYTRSASMVKTWASNERLARAGFKTYNATPQGLTHARDAMRHALFCAVHDFGVKDPLSKRAIPNCA